jgi:hypothetical protein
MIDRAFGKRFLLQSNRKAIESDRKSIAMRSQCDCKEIAKRLQRDGKEIAKRLQRDRKVFIAFP